MENDAKWHFLQSKLRNERTGAVFQTLREHDIEPVLLKGSAIERFYPKDTPRPAVDIDIAVAPEEFAKTKRIHAAGELGRFNIDIHDGLRHLDSRPWPEIFAQTRLTQLEGAAIRILRPEDQLRVICIHWLTDGGERFDRLLDVFYMTEGRAEDFDWTYCLGANGGRRRRWVLSVMALTHKHCPLDLNRIPFAGELEIPEWFVSAAESRWADDVKFEPLDTAFFKKGSFFPQLRRRFPPNPIMATIALEGEIDESSRKAIQFRYFIKRLIPSLTRSSATVMGKLIRKR